MEPTPTTDLTALLDCSIVITKTPKSLGSFLWIIDSNQKTIYKIVSPKILQELNRLNVKDFLSLAPIIFGPVKLRTLLFNIENAANKRPII